MAHGSPLSPIHHYKKIWENFFWGNCWGQTGVKTPENEGAAKIKILPFVMDGCVRQLVQSLSGNVFSLFPLVWSIINHFILSFYGFCALNPQGDIAQSHKSSLFTSLRGLYSRKKRKIYSWFDRSTFSVTEKGILSSKTQLSVPATAHQIGLGPLSPNGPCSS